MQVFGVIYFLVARISKLPTYRDYQDTRTINLCKTEDRSDFIVDFFRALGNRCFLMSRNASCDYRSTSSMRKNLRKSGLWRRDEGITKRAR